MNERKIVLPTKNLNTLSTQDKEKSLQYLAEKSRLIFTEYIREVYLVNSRIRQKRNYVPLEQMISAVRVEYKINPLSFTIYIEEDDIIWKDAQGNSIYAIEETQEDNEIVSDLWSHWQTPIDNKQEEDWIIESSIKDIMDFIKTDYIKYLNKFGRK